MKMIEQLEQIAEELDQLRDQQEQLKNDYLMQLYAGAIDGIKEAVRKLEAIPPMPTITKRKGFKI